jgi:uncharacterized protein YaiE (UPF0345 family)
VTNIYIVHINSILKMMILENQYFEGNVKSLGYATAEGKSTVGVINAGEYKFGTAEKEIMHIIEGSLSVLLPGSEEWKTFEAGSSFVVLSNSSFKVKAEHQVAYLCQYR